MFYSNVNIFTAKKKFKDVVKILLVSLFFCIFLIFLDQYIKWLVVENLRFKESVLVIPSVFKVTYVRNYGAAFSILFKKTAFLIFFAVVTIFALILYIIKKKIDDKLYIFSFSLIVAGGVGNLIDRVLRGYVVDYIDLIFWPLEDFAVFNLADFLIVTGSILFLFKFAREEFFNSDGSGYKNIKRI